jgi:hypothetical protein
MEAWTSALIFRPRDYMHARMRGMTIGTIDVRRGTAMPVGNTSRSYLKARNQHGSTVERSLAVEIQQPRAQCAQADEELEADEVI